MKIEGLGEAIQPQALGSEVIVPDRVAYAPLVLRGIAADIANRHERREGDYFLTPVAQVDDEVAGEVQVQIGRRHYEGNQTLFLVDEQVLRPWYRLQPEHVMQGDGGTVVSLAGRKRVAAILRSTGAALDAAVLNELQAYDPAQVFEIGVVEQIAAVDERMAMLRAESEMLKQQLATPHESTQEPLKTVITIRSSWSRDGESSPTTSYDLDVSLVQALERAAADFREVNRRSDVQGSPSIMLRRGAVEVEVPARVWQNFFQMIAGPQGFNEQNSLKRVQAEQA